MGVKRPVLKSGLWDDEYEEGLLLALGLGICSNLEGPLSLEQEDSLSSRDDDPSIS